MIENVIVALAWLATQPQAETVPSYESEVVCVAKAIYHEARGEPLAGQIRVGRVVINRMRDRRWPESACEVVYQPYQFEWTRNEPEIKEEDAFARSIYLASAVYNMVLMADYKPKRPALYFFNPEKVQPIWARDLHHVTHIGGHLFLTDTVSDE